MDSNTANVMHGWRLLIVVLLAWAWPATAPAQVTDYVVGPQDVLLITLFDQPELDRRFVVEADGTFTFHYIGRVRAGGQTLRAIEQLLRKELANGYFRNPQVSVAVEHYRSQRVFVTGEVRVSGPVPLTGEMTLIEAIAVAGPTASAGGVAVITRLKPVSGTDGSRTETIRIDIRDLQTGKLTENLRLQDGDAIYIPPAEVVDVIGQVKNPGPYHIRRGMTVRQALSAAGGMTDRAAEGRVKITRNQDGTRREINVKLDDVVQPDDIITVPERRF